MPVPMFGPRLRSLFTSRWMALLWAAWICLMAVQFIGGPKDADGADAGQAAGQPDNADIATAKAFLEH